MAKIGAKIGWISAILLLAACSAADEPGKPVPIGDKSALERLAAAYDKVSAERSPIDPRRLSPSQRKDFVVRVFAASGYSYSSTLHQLAQGGWDVNDQNAKDLVDLVFMPHSGGDSSQGVRGVYSEQELADVRKVQRMMP